MYQDINVCGGRELVAISMIECLKKRGFDIVLFTGRKVNNHRIKQYFGKNVQIDKEIEIRLWKRNTLTYSSFLLSGFAKRFCDILINPLTSDILPGVDITYIHYPNPLILAEKVKKNRLWHALYQPYLSLENASSHNFSKKLVMANSFFTANAVKKQFGISPLVIYPPVQTEKITPETHIERKNVVLTVSRFSFGKGLEQIPYLAKNINAQFVIVGSVYSRKAYYTIKNLIEELDVGGRVVLIPNAPLEKKLELLRKAKVYLHTTPFEHFGISIIEGMAAGCIPVVHDSGGPREFVPLMWRYQDKEDAVQKIQRALKTWSPTLAQDMENIAYNFREQRFQQDFLSAVESFIASSFSG